METIISTCTGIGGLDLGVERALGGRCRTVAYVEREAFCVAHLAATMQAGALDPAPIFPDLALLPAGLGASGIIGGIPCQPFSAAGKQKGTADDRWLWPTFWETTIKHGCGWLFLENVPGIAARALHLILDDLSAIGWSAEWGVLSAQAVGANHVRKRFFLLAADSLSGQLWQEQGGEQSQRKGEAEPRENGKDRLMANPDSARPPRCDEEQPPARSGPRTPGRSWWATEPDVGRVADGVPARVDRIRALGNACVPLQAETAFRQLAGRLRS